MIALSKTYSRFCGVNHYREHIEYPSFEKNGLYDATAMVFSPDGTVLYLATSAGSVWAVDSSGLTSSHEEKFSGNHEACDLAISPNGLSVR